jgi:hypothetical protein
VGSYGYSDESDSDAEEAAEHILIQELYFNQDNTRGADGRTTSEVDAAQEEHSADPAETQTQTQQPSAVTPAVRRAPNPVPQPHAAWLQVTATFSSAVTLRFRPLAPAQVSFCRDWFSASGESGYRGVV